VPFPEGPPESATIIAQNLLPAGGNEVGRSIVRQSLDFAAVETADDVECAEQIRLSAIGSEGQRQKRRQGFAKVGMAGDDGIHHASGVVDGDGTASHDGRAEAIGADTLTQAATDSSRSPAAPASPVSTSVKARRRLAAAGFGIGGVPGASGRSYGLSWA
jgi:hypothetical protein